MPRTIRRTDSPRGYRQMSSTTPDMDVVKVADYTTSPHLLDHGYGATPQNQLMNAAMLMSTNAATAPVKRKLNLESRACVIPIKQEFKTPSIPTTNHTISTKKKRQNTTQTKKNTRYDTSLGLLTKKFSALLESSPNGVVDLNKASQMLKVQKRRIYDITNVLEGIGILEKKSKNNIQWRGGMRNTNSTFLTLKNEVEDLENQENELDLKIQVAESQLRHLTNDTHGYVTYHDLRSIESLKSSTVIVVKAPPNTQLSVSSTTDSDDRYSIQMKSMSEPIKVFLCPDYVPPPIKPKIVPPIDPLLKDFKLSPCLGLTTPPVPSFDSPNNSLCNHRPVTSQVCRNLSFSKDPVVAATPNTPLRVQNFNSQSDDHNTNNTTNNMDLDPLNISPLFGTSYSTMNLGGSDVNLMNDSTLMMPSTYTSTTNSGMDPFFGSEPFLPLEPLMQSEYNFSLDASEGLADLFDLKSLSDDY